MYRLHIHRCSPCSVLLGVLCVHFFFSGSAIAADCNGNGVDDGQDLSHAISQDCNADAIPDECQEAVLRFTTNSALELTRAGDGDVVAVDLDGDGDLDVATGVGSDLSVFLNEDVTRQTGFEGLSPPAIHDVGSNVKSMASGDVDGDSRVDLLTSSIGSFSVFWNLGDGSFGEPTTVTFSAGFSGLSDVSVLDLHGDGLLEVAVVNGSQVFVFPNSGDRDFQPPVTLSRGGGPRSILSGDLDGDGETDILTRNRDSSQIAIFLNEGSSDGGVNFSSAQSIVLQEAPRDVVAGDFNGDGALDLAVAAGAVVIFLNRGDGLSFEESVFHAQSTILDAADVDGDGDLDIVSNFQHGQVFSVLINGGGGVFRAKLDFDFALSIGSFEEGDFDGDGHVDFAVAHRNKTLAFFRNGQEKSVSVEFDSSSVRYGRPPHAGILGDLDGDGNLDFATGDGAHKNLTLLFNDGAGNFTSVEPTPFPDRSDTLVLADFDGDGDNDLVVGGHDWSGLSLLKNEGRGQFLRQRVALNAGIVPFYVATADLDGDGSPDLIGASERAGSIAVLLNDGSGGFPKAIQVRVGSGTRCVAPGDFDGDGDLDLASANTESQDIAILTNRGDGRFEDRVVSFSAGAHPVFVVSGDWNEDGYDDLAAANFDEVSVGIFLNRQDGTFEDPEFIGVFQSPYSMTTPADINGDGLLDLIVTSERGTVSFVLKDRRGGFFFADHLTLAGGPRFSDVGDVDGDGDVDLVVANRGAFDVSVHLTRTTSQLGRAFAEHICTLKDFEELAVSTGDGLTVKYTLPARDDPSLLAAVFQNGNRYALHHEFLAAIFPDRFAGLTASGLIGLTQLRATRDYYIGAVQRIDRRRISNDERGFVHIYSILTAPGRGEVLTVDEVRGVHERISAALTLEPLLYAPDPTGEAPLAREAAETWGDPGFPIFSGTVIGETEYIPYTQAVGYGRVRLFSKEEFDAFNASGRLTFQDIAVIDHAPRDIEGIVGGVITAAPQGILSHVSVRTARRGTPNAFVSQALGVFVPYEGLLVRLEVGEREFTVQEASQEEAEEFWDMRPSLPPLLPVDTEYSGLDRFEDMDFSGAVSLETRFGGKATGLARLQTILTGPWEQYREVGFAIPMSYYFEFMRSNRKPSKVNGDFLPYDEYLEEIFSLPDFQTDSAFRFAMLDEFRDFARALGRVPEGLVTTLADRIEKVFGTRDLAVRFRSSSNVEDRLQFNGAGLYESTQVCVPDSFDADGTGPSLCDSTKDNERTIERALKKVWTSLWTFRAHEEREFFRIPQDDVSQDLAMGILVNRAFLDEAANGVAFTGDPTNPRGGCYLVTVQVGEESVVSPDPGVLAEMNILEVADGQVQRIVRAQRSSLTAVGEVVLSDEKLSELGALMWHIDKNYPLDTEGRDRDEILLDLEFKLERDGSLAVKQVRPFLPAGERGRQTTFELEVPSGTAVCGGLNLVSPSGSIRTEYNSKGLVRFLAQTVEFPSSQCIFTGELFEEVLVGPEAELALPEGPGVFRADDRPHPSRDGTLHVLSYKQFFSLEGGRIFEVNLFNLEFASFQGTPVETTLVLDEEFIANNLTMLGLAQNPDLTVTFSSCSDSLLPAWEIEARLDDGTFLRLHERFLLPEEFTQTGPASLQAAEVFIGGRRDLVTSYWDLVYAAGRHNISVTYWVVLDPPVSLEGIDGDIHAIELRAPDRPEVFDLVAVPQVEGAFYLDENFEVLAQPDVLSFEKRPADDVQPTRFLRGDATADGAVNAADAIRILSYLFLAGEPLLCSKAADADDDGRMNLSDAVRVLLYAFRGKPLAAPSPTCGVDLTPDALSCETFLQCF